MAIGSVPRGTQKHFMVKTSLLYWIAVIGFTATRLLMSASWNWLMWMLYGPALVCYVRYVNRSLATMRGAKSA